MSESDALKPDKERLKSEIERRLGCFPPFLVPIEENLQVLESLWNQTRAAYLDCPLPPLFKEKLQARLARYCSVSYAIVFHTAALWRMGFRAQSILELLESPAPSSEADLQNCLNVLEAQTGPWSSFPEPGSTLEHCLLQCSIFCFVKPGRSNRARQAMIRLLGAEMQAGLTAFLAYIKSYHLWVESCPGQPIEDLPQVWAEFVQTLREEPRLAKVFRNYRERIQDKEETKPAQPEELQDKLRPLQDKIADQANAIEILRRDAAAAEDAIREQTRELSKANEELRRRLTDLESEKDGLHAALLQSEAKTAAASKDYEVLAQQVAEHEKKKEFLRSTLAEMETRVGAAFKAHADCQVQISKEQSEKEALQCALTESASRAGALEETIQTLERKIDELKSKEQSNLDAAAGAGAHLQEQIIKLEQDSATLQDQIRMLEQEAVSLRQALASAEARSAELGSTVDSLRGQVASQEETAIALGRAAGNAQHAKSGLEFQMQSLILLADLGNLLRSCTSLEEVKGAISQGIEQIYPERAGVVYVTNRTAGNMEAIFQWGEPATMMRSFIPDQCFAVRRNRIHSVKNPKTGLLCKHVITPTSAGYICAPMMAGADVLGVLHLSQGAAGEISQMEESMAAAVMEILAATLAAHGA
jgi:predicted  nucleic acid-binding Zn-ribbon protein